MRAAPPERGVERKRGRPLELQARPSRLGSIESSSRSPAYLLELEVWGGKPEAAASLSTPASAASENQQRPRAHNASRRVRCPCPEIPQRADMVGRVDLLGRDEVVDPAEAADVDVWE
jgi:hypothetical protein